MPFGRSLLSEWLLDPAATFLNHGSFGAAPHRVLAAQAAWRERLERQPVHFLGRELAGLLREAAAHLAAFVGAQPADLVFVDNATSGINAVLRSLSFKPGERVVTTSYVYNAVRQALRFVTGRSGAELVEVELPFPVTDAEQIVAAFARALDLPARLVILDHLASAPGLILPLERLVALCRERGVPVLIDGAHAPGMLPLDVAALGVDWYAGNGHKWLCAPKGCAFLWTCPQRQAETEPLVISHGWGSGYQNAFDWPGTRDPSGWLAVGEAIAFLESFDLKRVRHYNHTLALTAAQRFIERFGGTLPGPPQMLAAMVTLPLPSAAHPETLNERLWYNHRIEVPVYPFAGRWWLRISAQIYNEPSDYERLAEALTQELSS